MAQQILVPVAVDDSAPLLPVPPAWWITCYGSRVSDSNDHQGWFAEVQPCGTSYLVTAPTGAQVDEYVLKVNAGRVGFHYLVATGTFNVGPG